MMQRGRYIRYRLPLYSMFFKELSKGVSFTSMVRKASKYFKISEDEVIKRLEKETYHE